MVIASARSSRSSRRRAIRTRTSIRLYAFVLVRVQVLGTSICLCVFVLVRVQALGSIGLHLPIGIAKLHHVSVPRSNLDRLSHLRLLWWHVTC